ncbi:MAG TPA: TonB-dependent receptor [Steroidobacteraceae bacterium]|jgi:iron complex outermembrane receptor protein|nr:TonB-dependent receptor [Steroidobacteraceae bacterium]
MRTTPQALATALLLCSVEPAAASQDGASTTGALKHLSIEELMDIEVTSVSRAPETLNSAAAAVSVITNEAIRRSGATTIPEALRGVPGLHVARRNSDSWAVSSRAFSSINSEKLLVLSDTRSIYTPLVSGVFWDVQDYLMEDIERIEVIRGPGASLWGSNAVNGVISITTKHARNTQGTFLSATVGTEELGSAAARYGGRFGESGFFRVFGQYSDRAASFKPRSPTSDDWRIGHAGFRADWDASSSDALTLQADLYSANIGQYGPGVSIIGRPGPSGDLEVHASGGNVLGRWRRDLGGGSDLQLRAYYDNTHRNDPSFRDDLETFDLDLQHRYVPSARHEIVWGLNYRVSDNDNRGKGVFALDPQDSRDQLFGGFAQDQFAISDALRLTVGTKLEHNDFSGFEVQPTVRLSWDVAPRQNAWAAVSRAVRVPTRLERDIAIEVTPPGSNPRGVLLGDDEFDAEELLAYELGYRWQPLDALGLDLALFHNRYEGLASLEFGTPTLDPQTGVVTVPVVNRNLTDARSQGAELLATFWARDNWRLIGSYSYIYLDMQPHGGDLNRAVFLEGATPRQQFSLRSLLDLPGRLQLDAQFRHSAALERLPGTVDGAGIDGYSELDVRVAWQASEHLELSLVGQNLLHDHHLEFGTPATRGEIERSVYGKAAWRF